MVRRAELAQRPAGPTPTCRCRAAIEADQASHGRSLRPPCAQAACDAAWSSPDSAGPPGPARNPASSALTGTSATNGSPATMRTGGARWTSRPRWGAADTPGPPASPACWSPPLAKPEHVTVLHYDGDYDLIAAVTGQPMRWVIPRRGHPPTSAPPAAPAQPPSHPPRSRTAATTAQPRRGPDSPSRPA